MPEIEGDSHGSVAQGGSPPPLQSSPWPPRLPSFRPAPGPSRTPRWTSWPRTTTSKATCPRKATVAPGRYTLNFSNPSTPSKPELHEIRVVLLRDGQTLEQALQGEGKLKFVGGAFALDGATSTGELTLDKEGRYGFACFIPVNSDTPDECDDGAPHAFVRQGMVGEFRVSAG